MKLRRRWLAAVALAAGAALAARPAAAQVSIEASPLRVEVQAVPGGTNTQSVTLTNVGTQPVRVRTSLADWYLSREGTPQFEEPGPARPFTASGWVRFAPPEFIIGGGQQGTVRFTVTVPQGAEAAGYRTGLLFDFSPNEPDGVVRAKQVTVRSRIATLIYVHVAQAGPAGHPPASVELTDLQVRTKEQTEVVATLEECQPAIGAHERHDGPVRQERRHRAAGGSARRAGASRERTRRRRLHWRLAQRRCRRASIASSSRSMSARRR